MKYVPLTTRLLRELNKNKELKSENAQLKADLDYVAMMTDVELYEEGEEDE